MKFGGTSVGDAERVLAVAELVRSRLEARPVVVVSALAGVTDLLVEAVAAAARGDRERLEPLMATLERKHRWAVAGAIEDARRRHDLSLSLDALFEELRQLLRAVRVLGEETPRAADALLAYGELLSSRILAAALEDRGVRARLVDPREIVRTDGRHGAAEPDLEALAETARRELVPVVEAGEVPVMGGFVGAGPDRRTTTLGRGGSDTTAAAVGAVLGAEEIQIWTDVDGLMTADPKIVPEARTLPRVSFAEAAELAFYGAKVLHPASILPAVQRRIPVRILNALRPDSAGTLVVEEAAGEEARLASIASRAGVRVVRVASRRLRADPAFLPRVFAALEKHRVAADLAVCSEMGVTVVVPAAAERETLSAELGGEVEVGVREGRALVSVVGSVLLRDAGVRALVVEALGRIEPEALALSGAGPSVAAVVPEERFREAVRFLHREFIEGQGRAAA